MLSIHKITITIIFLMVTTIQAQAQEDFPYPSVPAELTTPETRADYVVRHYWDNVNFQDTTLIHRSQMIEQGFVNFIDLLRRLNNLEQMGWRTFTQKAFGKNATYDKYMKELAERYLYATTSPMQNDSLYCHLLEAINQLPSTTEAEKEQNLFLIFNLNKNKVGTQAANFEYEDEKGQRCQLYDIKTPYTLLYLYDPDCETCHEVESEMNKDEFLQRETHSPTLHSSTPRLTIIKVNVMVRKDLWKIYYFRSFPTLYLLDSTKRVVLKDAELNKIVSFLKE